MPKTELRALGVLGAAVSLALGLGAGTASEHSGAPGSRVASQAVDAALRARVLRALQADAPSRDLSLSAQVEGGIATLQGRAPDLVAREGAVHAAARVMGLLGVRDEIEIVPAEGGDAALQRRLGEALAQELRSVRVEVTVKDAVATLSGLVENTTQRAAARNRAMRVAGLRGLDNQLAVRGEASLDDLQLQRRLVQLIENRRLYPLEGDVMVRVRDRRVTLSGEVPRVFDSLVAEKIVGIVSAVRGLTNEIRVVPSLGREVRQEFPPPRR